MGITVAGPASLDTARPTRWSIVLEHLVTALPYRGRLVLVDGFDSRAALLADHLAARLRDLGRPCVRLTADTCINDDDGWQSLTAGAVIVADGPRWRDRLPPGRWDLSIWTRTPATTGPATAGPVAGPVAFYGGDTADVVVDLHDAAWPVVRHIAAHLVTGDYWYRTESRAFFAARASTWDVKFGADLPSYTAAIAEADLPAGGVAVDVGCGTGRALPALREAVGADGSVIGIDHTPQMLAEAAHRARDCRALLLLADARHLPLPAGTADAVFAAGLVNHLPNPATGLRELARITRPGGRLVLFHPSGRAALAARHGRAPSPDDTLAEPVLRSLTTDTGWYLTAYTDTADRFYALARRR